MTCFNTSTLRILQLVIGSCLCLSPLAAEAGADALVAHWTFDDVAAGVVPDASGRGNHGTMQGKAGIVPGHIGSGALDCGSSGGAWVDIAPSSEVAGQPLEFNKNYTLMAWIKQPEISGWRIIISKAKDSEDKQYWIAGSELNGGWETGSGEGALEGGLMTAGVWTHVAYTCSDSKLLRLYINGRKVKEHQESHGLSKIDPSQIVRIGRMDYNKGFDFRGQIDDARIYNRALTPSEIEQLVGDKALYPPVASGLATATPAEVGVGETVTFTAPKATDENAGEVLSYRWDFGDGTTGTGRTAQHSYTSTGLYQALLTVTDPAGLSASYNRVFVGVGQSVPARLIAHWTFDGSLSDASGNGHHGTMQGGGGFADGKTGQALELAGGDQYVTVPNHAQFDALTADFTIMAWIKPSADFPKNGGILNKAYVKDHTQFTLELATHDDKGAKLPSAALCTASANNGWFRLIGGEIAPTNWQHVAMSATPAGKNLNHYRLFIDGKQVTEIIETRFPSIDEPLWIGRGGSWWAQNNGFKGRIDDLRVYGYGMTESQIAVAMNAAPAVSAERTIQIAVQFGESSVETTVETRQFGDTVYGPTSTTDHRIGTLVATASTAITFLDGPIPSSFSARSESPRRPGSPRSMAAGAPVIGLTLGAW